ARPGRPPGGGCRRDDERRQRAQDRYESAHGGDDTVAPDGLTETGRPREVAAMGCDTLVALGGATRDRVALFAKNSDRPPRECQHVVRLPAARHAPGARVR